MKNMFKQNVGLLVPRQFNGDFHHVLVSDKPTNCNLTGTAKKFGSAPLFPLYIYKENMGQEERIVNFNKELYDKIAKGLNCLNAEQYFDGVPESAWNFFIGGYQPAQKWLKDRKGMTLSFEDVKHYGTIIYVLQQTERLMGDIDNLMKKE